MKFRRRLAKPLALAIAVSHAMPAFAHDLSAAGNDTTDPWVRIR